MASDILHILRAWRDRQARMEGVETFRVFPNTVLAAIVEALPRTKDELLSIKGIKDAKCRKYGATLLRLIAEQTTDIPHTSPALHAPQEAIASQVHQTKQLNPFAGTPEENAQSDLTLSVSRFLDGLNVELSGMAARVRGEVSSVEARERVVYFTLKDSKDESTLNCLMFRTPYIISGVSLTIGDEIIVEGVPEVYKPSGRLSMKVGIIELAGAGALQKAYAALKQKLEQEGLLAPARKRALPELPENIALITSEQGAAIGDFTTNLGSQGMKVSFYPTSVEGKKAIFEIIHAIRYFNRKPEQYDILILVRGGGSLESLQAFNNETLAREVAGSHIPTLCGIGHEKDITLAALVADMMVSTPTAAARTLRASWEEARSSLVHTETRFLTTFERKFLETEHRITTSSHALVLHLDQFSQRFQRLRERFLQQVTREEFHIEAARQRVESFTDQCERLARKTLETVRRRLAETTEALRRYDPRRALALGYSLIYRQDVLLKRADRVKKGDQLTLRLARGRLETEVTAVYNE